MAGSKRSLSAAEGVAIKVGGILASHILEHDYGVAARLSEIEVRKVCHGITDVEMEFMCPYDQPVKVRVQLADRCEIFGMDPLNQDPELFRAQAIGGGPRMRGEKIDRQARPFKTVNYELEDLKRIPQVDKFCLTPFAEFKGFSAVVSCDGGRKILKKTCRNLGEIALKTGEWMKHCSFGTIDQYILSQEWAEAAAKAIAADWQHSQVMKLVEGSMKVDKTSHASRWRKS